MFTELILSILIGILLGIITGLTPGIHINLISALILTLSSRFTSVPILFLCTAIIAMAITHSFLDSIPGVYLGAPDEAMALSVLPGHRYLLNGEGQKAVYFTLIGSLLTLLIALASTPIFLFLLEKLSILIKNKVGYILIATMLFLLYREKNKIKPIFIFFLSGILGIVVLDFPNLNQPLFPLLSGLFGTSLLLISLETDNKIPKQYNQEDYELKPNYLLPTTLATTVGFFAAFLPGLGSSQAAIIAQTCIKKANDKIFLILVGGINTANMLISISTFYILDKSRNGAILVVKELTQVLNKEYYIIFLITALIAASFAFVLGIKLSKKFSSLITKINYKKLVLSIIIFIAILTFLFDRLVGLIILLASTSLGILTTKLGVAKNYQMGCLMLPVILFFVT